MLLYYGLVIYIIATGIFFNTSGRNKKNIIYMILTMGVLLTLSSLRSQNVGNDTDNYISLFKDIQLKGISGLVERYELGYLLFNLAISKITSNSQCLLIVTSIFIFIGYSKFIYKYSENKFISVYMFFTLMYFGFSLSGIRQAMAGIMLLKSYEYIIKKNKIKFIIIVIIASLFHSTAILFLIAYPISKIKYSFKVLLISSSITATCYTIFPVILKVFMSIFYRYDYYQGSEYFNGQIRIASVLNLLIFLIIFAFASIVKYNKCEFDSCKISILEQNRLQERNSQMMLLLIGILIMFLSLKLNILDRVAMYFHVYSIIVLPNSIQKIKNKKLKVLIILLTIYSLFIYSTAVKIIRPDWQHIFPYTFYWV